MKNSQNGSGTDLVIDCQVFQTVAWHRGMGKYSRELVAAVCNSRQLGKRYNSVSFLFNSNLPLEGEIVDFIKQIYPSAQLLQIDLARPREPRLEYSVAPVIEANKATLDKLLDTQFQARTVTFLILALYLDEVCSAFPSMATEKAVVYYDSIPYIYHERYDQFAGFFDNFYLPHTKTIYEATKILTISKTVANDLHILLGLPEDVIFNIDGASITRTAKAVEPERLKLQPNEFVLMPTGQELRKNNKRAIKAFEKFRKESGTNTRLVITSFFTEVMKRELLEVSKQIIFSGNVPENEMSWLLRNCRFVLFPSEYEGLGLPILEAVEEGKHIACSDISVFREISPNAFTYFDPLDVNSITESLATNDAIGGAETPPPQEYKNILAKYTWEKTANHFFEAMQAINSRAHIKRKKIAIFCPEPSGFSAIGKVVTESHACYAKYFDITYYFDKGPMHQTIRPNILRHLVTCHPIEDFKFEDVAQYDALIYHIGNSEYHLNIIQVALAIPGYVVLHDTHLYGAYVNLVEQGYMSQQRLDLETMLDKLLPDNDETDTPRSEKLTSLSNNQYGILVHSKYAQDAVKKKLINGNKTRLAQVNLPVDTPIFPEILRQTSGKCNISFAGIIAKVKGTDIIEEIAQSEDFWGCNVRIFGYSAVEPERLEELKKLPHVRLITNPSDHEFQTLMASTDILLNVRMAYKGETSLTTLEAMRYGAVVLVRNFGWYAELPDDSVIHIDDPKKTLRALRQVLAKPEKLASTGQRALDYMKQKFNHTAYAEGMYKLISETKSSRTPEVN